MRRVFAPSQAALGLPQGQRLARRVEAVEPFRHLVDLAAEPNGVQPQPVRRKAVQVVEDANEGAHRRRLAGVDLAADEVERPLEPGNLEKGVVVGRVGVAALELLTNDLLHPADAQALRSGDGPDRLAADEASEDAPGALVRLRAGSDGFGGSGGHRASFGETARVTRIPEFRKHLSKKVRTAKWTSRGEEPVRNTALDPERTLRGGRLRLILSGARRESGATNPTQTVPASNLKANPCMPAFV